MKENTTEQKVSTQETEDCAELLRQYEDQTKDGSVHGYSEVFHNDTHTDYSDSDCCC